MSDPWAVHTIVFDLDDTLYPECDFVYGGFAAVDSWLRAQHGLQGFETQARALFAAGHRGRIFDEVLAAFPGQLPAQIVPALIDVYRSHLPQLRLFADADTALHWASAAKLRSALITDGYTRVQRAKIDALGLPSRIGVCIVTDELGGKDFWKPHPAAFRQVMAAHPGPASGYVYIADNPRKDFIAPHQLGWRTLRIRRPGGEHARYEGAADENAAREIQTLAGLDQLLRPSS